MMRQSGDRGVKEGGGGGNMWEGGEGHSSRNVELKRSGLPWI